MLAGHIAKTGETRNNYRIFVAKKNLDNVHIEGREGVGNKIKVDLWMTVCEKQKQIYTWIWLRIVSSYGFLILEAWNLRVPLPETQFCILNALSEI